MAEPILLLLVFEFVEFFAEVFEVSFVDDLFGGEVVELGFELLPCLRLLGGGGWGDGSGGNGDQESGGEQGEGTERRDHEARPIPAETGIRADRWRRPWGDAGVGCGERVAQAHGGLDADQGLGRLLEAPCGAPPGGETQQQDPGGDRGGEEPGRDLRVMAADDEHRGRSDQGTDEEGGGQQLQPPGEIDAARYLPGAGEPVIAVFFRRGGVHFRP